MPAMMSIKEVKTRFENATTNKEKEDMHNMLLLLLNNSCLERRYNEDILKKYIRNI